MQRRRFLTILFGTALAPILPLTLKRRLAWDMDPAPPYVAHVASVILAGALIPKTIRRSSLYNSGDHGWLIEGCAP